jgi:hypothetical protein
VQVGATWTTDAPFRETQEAIDAAAAVGILALEMEAAALYAFGKACGRSVLGFAHVTNQMGRSEGDFEKGAADGAAASLMAILRCRRERDRPAARRRRSRGARGTRLRIERDTGTVSRMRLIRSHSAAIANPLSCRCLRTWQRQASLARSVIDRCATIEPTSASEAPTSLRSNSPETRYAGSCVSGR